MTPKAFIQKFIQDHEGVLSLHPNDTGNYYRKVLVGSKYGVTGDTLAAFLNRKDITPAEMKTAIAALTLAQAVDIGYANFYVDPGFDKLVWNQATAAILDHGWMSGPATAVKIMQRTVGVPDDGHIGPVTAQSYQHWINSYRIEDCAAAICRKRIEFFKSIGTGHNATFLSGWINRANSFLPGTVWWKGF